MCMVYEFPVKKEFPKELGERLNTVVEDFVNIMAEAVDIMYDGGPTEEEYVEFTEMMLEAYLKSLVEAIDRL